LACLSQSRRANGEPQKAEPQRCKEREDFKISLRTWRLCGEKSRNKQGSNCMYKPPLIFVTFCIACAFFANYCFYLIWFKPQKVLKTVIKLFYKLPDWYPFRRLFIMLAHKEKGLITFYRIGSVFAEIFIIFLVIYYLNCMDYWGLKARMNFVTG
jgi:hypothetical protein